MQNAKRGRLRKGSGILGVSSGEASKQPLSLQHILPAHRKCWHEDMVYKDALQRWQALPL